jgi:acyl carrier protein
LEEKVKEILARILGIPPEAVTEETSTETSATWDSLRHISVILTLEETFKTRFTGEEIVEMLSLKAIVGRLRQRGF